MASSHPAPKKPDVVALPSMTHSLAHLPTMPAVDPRCLHYGSLGASKEASHAKLQQTLQRRDSPSICPSSSASHDPSPRRPPPPQPSPRKMGPPAADDDGDYLMMKKVA